MVIAIGFAIGAVIGTLAGRVVFLEIRVRRLLAMLHESVEIADFFAKHSDRETIFRKVTTNN